MATYYDGLNNFYKLNELNPLQSSAQLVYLHLLHLNNRLGNSGTVQVSDRALKLSTNLSQQSITNAKRFLKNRGLIDFKTDRNNPNKGTNYKLIFFTDVEQQVVQQVEQTVGHQVEQLGSVPYTHAHEDLRRKTEKEEEEETRARVQAEAGVRESPRRAKSREVREDPKEDDLTTAYAKPLSSTKFSESAFDSFIENWDESPIFCKLDQLLISKLKVLFERYGQEVIEKAMILARERQKTGVNLAFFEGSIEKVLQSTPSFKEKEKKGSDENGRRNKANYSKTFGEYEIPDYGENSPWDNE